MTSNYFIHLTAEEAIERIAYRVAELLSYPAKPEPDHNNSTSPHQDEIIGKKDVSQILNISLTTVTNWMKSGALPFYRKGRKVFFKKSEVVNSLDTPKNGKQKSGS